MAPGGTGDLAMKMLVTLLVLVPGVAWRLPLIPHQQSPGHRPSYTALPGGPCLTKHLAGARPACPVAEHPPRNQENVHSPTSDGPHQPEEGWGPLTRCRMSVETICMQHMAVARAHTMVERTLRAHTLKSRSCEERRGEGQLPGRPGQALLTPPTPGQPANRLRLTDAFSCDVLFP